MGSDWCTYPCMAHRLGEMDTGGSDIDVLVVLDGLVSPCAEIARTVNDVAEISLKYGVVIACVFVSKEAYEHEQSPLLLNVRDQEIAI